jgi:1-acyl-sn-glycerol-3-phosphate acyltransferase
MAPHHATRLRLAALCVAVACRAAVYVAVSRHCLTLLQGGEFGNDRPGRLAGWLGLSAVPALILVPLIGPLAGSRWNRTVLVVGSVLVVVVLAWARAEEDVPWPFVVGYLSLELAFFVTAALALASAAAAAARLSATTARFWLVVAAAAGVWLAAVAYLAVRIEAPTLGLLLAVVGLGAVWVSGMRLAEPVALVEGIRKPFVAGVRDAVARRRARDTLVGLCVWSFVALSAATALVRFAAPDNPEIDRVTRSLSLAAAVGVLISGLNRHPFRHGGFVLCGALIVAGSVLCLGFWDSGFGPLFGLGFGLGLSIAPLVNFYFTWTTPRHYGVAASLIVAVACAAALVLAAILFNLGDDAAAAHKPLLNILLVVTGLAAVGSFGSFFRPAMEGTAEILLWVAYRIRADGPGLDYLPTRGPSLLIGNHAAWFDPLFLAKIAPDPITPMMTSKFYDLPILAWLMRHVIGTIRVPDKSVRHEAPELKEAVAALDRGECVVLFPEGFLRRKEDVPLRRFGRGVWQILTDRPHTLIFACWIEGAWGSYLSYRGGPPTKGKRFDFWRSIRVGVIGPIVVDAALLKDHMATRTFLMRQVSEARRSLGLEPVPLPTTHDPEGDKE